MQISCNSRVRSLVTPNLSDSSMCLILWSAQQTQWLQMNNWCPHDAQPQAPKMVKDHSNRAWKNLGVHKTIAKSDDFQKKKDLCCLSQSQKLQKKVVTNCQSHRNKFTGHLRKSSKMLLISSNRAKTTNFYAGRIAKKKIPVRVRLS